MLQSDSSSRVSIPRFRNDLMIPFPHVGVSSPAVAYCIMHQAGPRVPRDEYAQTLVELHGLLRENDAGLQAEHPRSVREAIVREVQVLLGSLSPFLQTPFRSDTVEVRSIVEESLGKFATRFAGGRPAGVQYSLEGRVYIPPSRKTAERRLLLQGREYLNGLGFGTARTDPSLHESMFVVDGGAGLDLLEHIVRDRIGIYAPTHGRHVMQFRRSIYAAFNMIHVQGTFPEPGAMAGCTEAALFFSKPKVHYEEFREQLISVANDLVGALGPSHCSIWQRKLGLGSGVEYVLRILAQDAADISGSIQWLSTASLEPTMKQVLLTEGRLVVKEILYPS
jgi:hypothetical protein